MPLFDYSRVSCSGILSSPLSSRPTYYFITECSRCCWSFSREEDEMTMRSEWGFPFSLSVIFPSQSRVMQRTNFATERTCFHRHPPWLVVQSSTCSSSVWFLKFVAADAFLRSKYPGPGPVWQPFDSDRFPPLGVCYWASVVCTCYRYLCDLPPRCAVWVFREKKKFFSTRCQVKSTSPQVIYSSAEKLIVLENLKWISVDFRSCPDKLGRMFPFYGYDDCRGAATIKESSEFDINWDCSSEKRERNSDVAVLLKCKVQTQASGHKSFGAIQLTTI